MDLSRNEAACHGPKGLGAQVVPAAHGGVAGGSDFALRVLWGRFRYSIADIAIFPWIRNLFSFYEAGELVKFEEFSNVTRVLAAFVPRPAVAKGLEIPKRG